MKRSDFLKRLALLIVAPEVMVDLAENLAKVKVEPAIVISEPSFKPIDYGGRKDAFYAYMTDYIQIVVHKHRLETDRMIYGHARGILANASI